jgi:hypothetical protein
MVLTEVHCQPPSALTHFTHLPFEHSLEYLAIITLDLLDDPALANKQDMFYCIFKYEHIVSSNPCFTPLPFSCASQHSSPLQSDATGDGGGGALGATSGGAVAAGKGASAAAGGAKGAAAVDDGDQLDDGEQFEKLQKERVMGEDPDAFAFFAAKKQAAHSLKQKGKAAPAPGRK